jgi:tetratricopeptide (TPR) repeat protein
MREGLLVRAKIVLIYSLYDRNVSWERDKLLIQTTLGDINQIEKESNDYIKEGIKKYDVGERSKALELYYKALEIYPKNPWAWWEIRLNLQSDLLAKGVNILENNQLDSYCLLIKHLDPTYTIAYLPGKTSKEKARVFEALTKKVVPSLQKLSNGKEINESMKTVADGFFEMKEFELALYAYKYFLFHTYKDGFDQQVVYQITACLLEMNVESGAISYLGEWLNQIEKMKKAQVKE